MIVHMPNSTRLMLLKIFWLLLLLLAILLFSAPKVNAQQHAFRLPETEEEVFAQFNAKEWLTTAAQPAQFILIQPTRISRIVTLHRKPSADRAPITITLVNRTGEFSLGVWDGTLYDVPGAPDFVYCIVEVDKNAPPGRYEVRDSDPESWVNSTLTDQKGMVWVLTKKAPPM